MKKVVLKLDLHDHKEKRKAMKVVSGLSGIDSIAMDMKDKKLTVTGDFDPVMVVRKLRKQWHTDILTVGPAKEEKKDGEKKDGGGGGGGGAKKDDNKKKDEADPFKAPNGYFYYPYYNVTPYYHVVEDHPNSCVIC